MKVWNNFGRNSAFGRKFCQRGLTSCCPDSEGKPPWRSTPRLMRLGAAVEAAPGSRRARRRTRHRRQLGTRARGPRGCGRAPPSSSSAWRPRRRSCSTQRRARTHSSSTQQLADLKRAAARERDVTSVLATAVGALATVERDCGADTCATCATREKHAAARREIESLRKEHETLAMQHVLGAHARQLTRARQRRRRRGAHFKSTNNETTTTMRHRELRDPRPAHPTVDLGDWGLR